MMTKVKIVISSRSVITLMIFALLAWITYLSKDVLLLFFASFVIASALLPSVDWLSKKMPRGLAVAAIYTTIFLVMATMLVPFFYVISEQVNEFIKQIPSYMNEINKLIDYMRFNNSIQIPNFSEMLSTTTGIGKNIVNQSINLTANVMGGFIAAFTLATIILFLLLDKTEITKGFLKFFPEDTREKTEYIAKTISHKVGGYVRGQLIIMFITGLLTGIALYFAGVKFAPLLGMLAGIMEIIPIVGPILAAILAAIIATTQYPLLGLITIIIFFVVQRIQNHIISPWVFGKFLDLHPLIIILALLITASTIGVIGVILSPAIAAAVYVLIQELYLKEINEEN